MSIEVLRPNAAGDEENINEESPGGQPHWSLVDEAVSDDDTTNVKTNWTWLRDLYNIPDSGVGAGTITSVKVYANARAGLEPTQGSLKLAVKTGGTAYESSEKTVTTSYALYSNEWTTNPGGGSWTWAQINALQIGISIREGRPSTTVRTFVTQVWVEVDYTPTATSKTSSDSGSGSENVPLQTAALSGSESGQGQEAISSQLVTISAGDAGTSLETGGLLKELTAAELGQGSDLLVAKIESPSKGGGMKIWI